MKICPQKLSSDKRLLLVSLTAADVTEELRVARSMAEYESIHNIPSILQQTIVSEIRANRWDQRLDPSPIIVIDVSGTKLDSETCQEWANYEFAGERGNSSFVNYVRDRGGKLVLCGFNTSYRFSSFYSWVPTLEDAFAEINQYQSVSTRSQS